MDSTILVHLPTSPLIASKRPDSAGLPGGINAADKSDTDDSSQGDQNQFQIYQYKTAAWGIGQEYCGLPHPLPVKVSRPG